ncbi:acyl-CoA N-acyltransferase, partial [Chytridium lagenaria]
HTPIPLLDTGYDLTLLLPSDAPTLTPDPPRSLIFAHTLNIPSPYTLDHAKGFITYCIDKNNAGGGRGCRVYWGGVEVGKHVAELGYWLDEAHRGKGLMPLATRAMSRIAFSPPYNIHRLQAGTFPFNKASQRVLLKSGFKFEGVLRDYHFKRFDGKYYDGAMFSLLRSESGESGVTGEGVGL